MSKNTNPKKNGLTKVNDIKTDKIKVFFRKSILKSILKILTMEHSGFRTVKAVKNINHLFTSLDLTKYQNQQELISYIWCINFFSKQWLSGVVDPSIIAEFAKRQEDYDNIKDDIINSSLNDKNIILAPEAKAIFDLIGETLQYGLLTSMKEEYMDLLEDIDLSEPGAFRKLSQRLVEVSKSIMDIQHNTNLVANKISFNSSDVDSIKEAMKQTMESLTASSNMFKVGIRRLNTLLSPAYMNGRLYTYVGAPGSGKSIILLKSALDIRKYNPEFTPKTPGMKPCVLYVTMENSFTETIERIWNMTFDDPMTNFSIDEAIEKLMDELGIERIIADNVSVGEVTTYTGGKENKSPLLADIIQEPKKKGSNIELVIKYFSYREISTDDLFTIIQDLRDENMEVCALVFDYIKRIRPATPQADNVKLELNRIINELKALAVILDIPVITAHQMNRLGAAAMDSAARQGKGDLTKLVGRENIGDA